VIDADGINAFRGRPELLKDLPGATIVTPHPGEFVRLFGGRTPGLPRERVKRATEAAEKYRVIVVLKGRGTVVASPAGKTFVNSTGNAGMASGGTGDVLTGIVAALLGRGLTAWDAARFGVYAHGFAGDLAAAQKGRSGLVASDLLEFLPAALKKILRF
jgi:NAD(P)H-hydrate epimerase